MTKQINTRAIQVLAELFRNGAPDMVTPREASHLCETYGVTNDRFRRVAKREQNCRPTPLAAVAMEIARKEGKQ